MISYSEITFRLVLASILGGLIGLERESNNRPAGLRTHILVTIGAALVMLISMYGFDGLGENGSGGEPARLAAQVVSGIGFLGAGTILRQGNSIHGLTTAASLWVCGCIGLAIGNGYYLGGLITAGIVLFSLISLGFFEKSVFKNKYKTLHVICAERPGLIGEIGTLLGKNSITIKDIKMEPFEEDVDLHIDITIKIPSKFSPEGLFGSMAKIEGVKSAGWEGDLE
ncbi:MgtC/SapB family protein [Marinisporobacter balticus]|uniref:Putative Mg2+ transporter-C (MgtC) family protein n=1 Tax=Marinisporobacter balticus TaxID=2018667 RepID=A0A4R2KLI2_9FIRM|nr:MgtC/SapB family protein [Marinisporobacter balticus]TCO74533.1 putative Mg2+ transporter-C (MgtC) family protein [Marinisporobacter balticus]